jgi:hypothetical protein
MVTRDARLDSVVAGPPHALIFNYTFIGHPGLHMDAATSGQFRALVLQSSCSGQEQNLLSQGINLRYRYRREDGYVVADVNVNRADCLSVTALTEGQR